MLSRPEIFIIYSAKHENSVSCPVGLSFLHRTGILFVCTGTAEKDTKEFRLPDVPATLTAPEDRAAYLSLHYWDYFDFADTSLISRPEITEQAFVDFISILPYSSKAQTAVDTLFCRALTSNEMLYHLFR